MRKEVAQALRANRPQGSLSKVPFRQLSKNELLSTGRMLIERHVIAKRNINAQYLWSKSPYSFPFFTAFAEGFLYASFYATTKHNEPIDRNAQADYELLAYLTWADCVVSNDEGFLRHAFDAIWAPRGKKLMTCENFVALAMRLI